MRTTLKAQAIRLIAIFLLICASTTTVKAQISQHPELYKVKEFHNMDKDGGAYYCFTDAQYYQGKLYGVYIDNNGPSSIRLIAFEVNGETRTMEQSTVGDTGKKMIFSMISAYTKMPRSSYTVIASMCSGRIIPMARYGSARWI